MANEHTPEYVKSLFEMGQNLSRNDAVYAIRVLERVVDLGDPFYTAFALSLLIQNYRKIGRDDLEMRTITRITKLPGDQQALLSPNLVAACFQKSGDFKSAYNLLNEVLELTPHSTGLIAGLAEIELLVGDADKALTLVESFREDPDSAYQILGKMLKAFGFALRKEYDQSSKELHWIGQFLISSGSVPVGAWDYRDLQSIVAVMGPNAKAASLLLETLTGRKPLSEFTSAWNELTAPPQPGFGSPPVSLQT